MCNADISYQERYFIVSIIYAPTESYFKTLSPTYLPTHNAHAYLHM